VASFHPQTVLFSVFPECHQRIYLHLLARGFKASTTKLIVGLSESPLVLLPLLEITTIQPSSLWTLRVTLPVMLALTEPREGLDGNLCLSRASRFYTSYWRIGFSAFSRTCFGAVPSVSLRPCASTFVGTTQKSLVSVF
jgi:hypothetical protein